MRHRKKFRKFGVTVGHRRALLRNLATSLCIHGRIKTTVGRAKELKRVADKLVTLAKRGDLHSRRQALSYLFEVNKESDGYSKKRLASHRLFTEISEQCASRNGGYTRVVKIGFRPGDGAEMAFVEFVG